MDEGRVAEVEWRKKERGEEGKRERMQAAQLDNNKLKKEQRALF